MPFFRSGSGGTPGRILIFQEKKRYRLPLRHRQSRSYRRNLQPNQSDSVSRKPCQNRNPSDSRKTYQNRNPSGSPKLLLNRKRSNSRKQSLKPEAARQPQTSYQKVEIQDIRKLPKSNWNLCNNRFLLHGFSIITISC